MTRLEELQAGGAADSQGLLFPPGGPFPSWVSASEGRKGGGEPQDLCPNLPSAEMGAAWECRPSFQGPRVETVTMIFCPFKMGAALAGLRSGDTKTSRSND